MATKSTKAETILELYAEDGLSMDIPLLLWDREAKKLEQKGIRLEKVFSTPNPNKSKYLASFAAPVKGTWSEDLFHIAVEARKQLDEKSGYVPPNMVDSNDLGD